MRTVFSNAMCAHAWAQQTQPHGRSKSMRFDGDTIYSYATPIARIVSDSIGDSVALVTSHTYSKTTSSKHMPEVRRALSYMYFCVPSFGVSGGRHGRDEQIDHARNLAHLIEEYAALVGQLRRARSRPFGAVGDLTRLANAACGYAGRFGQDAPTMNPVSDAAAIAAHHDALEAKRSTPEYHAKQERARIRREARELERQMLARAERDERIAAWREGKPVTLRYYETHDPANDGALLRLRAGRVETSLGAHCPADHAQRAFAIVQQCRNAHREWARNGHSIHVGLFQIDRIAPNGDVRAGCHFIPWTEIERLAQTAGW